MFPLTIDIIFLLSLLKSLITGLQPAQKNYKIIAKTYSVLTMCCSKQFHPYCLIYIPRSRCNHQSCFIDKETEHRERLINLPRVTQPWVVELEFELRPSNLRKHKGFTSMFVISCRCHFFSFFSVGHPLSAFQSSYLHTSLLLIHCPSWLTNSSPSLDLS